jgi:hypothetical protein
MTNKQLTYGKSAIKTGFVGVPDRLSMYGQNFIDVPNMSAVDQITLINSEANQCRGWYEPVYSDNSKYLPIPPKEATAEMLSNVDSKQCNCKEKKLKQDEMWLKAILVGASIFVIYKLTQ